MKTHITYSWMYANSLNVRDLISIIILQFALGSVKFVFERSVKSKYSLETSTKVCNSISQCYASEGQKKIEEECGTVSDAVPPQYDPLSWGWELTGFSLCM